MTALENRLGFSVRAGDVSASGAFLRGIAGIDILDQHSTSLGFVGEEGLELVEIPTVEFPPLPLSVSRSRSDGREVFKDDGGSRIEALDNLLGNPMVHVSPEAVLLLGECLKVSLGGACSTGLQIRSQLFDPSTYLFYLTSVIEFIVGGNCQVDDSPVDPHDLVCRDRVGNVLLKNDGQKYNASSDKKVGRGSSPVQVLFEVFGNEDREFLSSLDRQEGNLVPVEPDVVASGVEPNRALLGLGAGSGELSFDPGSDSFEGFRGLHPGGAGKLGGKGFSGCSICFVVEGNPIEVLVVPSDFTDGIEGFGVSLDGGPDVFDWDVQFELNRSNQFHSHILSQCDTFVKGQSPERPGVSSHPLKGVGFHARIFYECDIRERGRIEKGKEAVSYMLRRGLV